MKINTMGISGNLNVSIDFQKMLELGDIFQLRKNKGYILLGNNITACIYHTGKVQIYGIKHVADVSKIWELTLSLIKKIVDTSVADSSAQIKFIVASDRLPYSLNLSRIVETFTNEHIEYEPEQFPGVIWQFEGGTVLLFSSGNIVITGPNSEEKIYEVIKKLRDKIENSL